MADEVPPAALADEVRRLLAAVQDWAKQATPAPTSGLAPECQWCPLCQAAHLLRTEHPEVAERLAEAGSAIAAALRAVLDAVRTDSAAVAPPPAARPRPRPKPGVQHIRIVDET